MKFFASLRALVALALVTVPLAAQDSTRGVRIGLTYDPGIKPGVVVMPGRGVGADSVRAIIQRDLDFGDRVNVIQLDSSVDLPASAPMWPVLAKLGAAAMIQVTPTSTGLHVAIYDVAKQTTALVRDYASPPMSDMRGWRAVVHGVSDELEESLTGIRGIARTRILFERSNRIWIVDSDGEQAMALTENGVSPAWNPSGTMMSYVILRPAQVVVQDLQTRRARTITGGSGVYISPTFTPDGANIVYSHGVDDGTDLYTAPLNGGGSHRISVGRGSDNVQPTFSPDGRRIAFTTGRAGHNEIYSMDADGTDAEPLTPLAFGERAHRASPDWSPDAQRVAFQSQIGSSFQILTINLRDRGMKQLTSDGENQDPSWASDARHMVFVSNRTGTRQLWVLDVETGRARQLTHGSAVRNNPAWSPRLTQN